MGGLGRAIVEAATAAIAAPGRRAGHAARANIIGFLWSGLLLAVLAFLVLYPIFMLVFGAVTGVNPVVDGFHAADISIDNFTAVLANPNVHVALLNSFVACAGCTALPLPIRLAFSWLVLPTNTPWKRLFATSWLLTSL